MLIVKLKVGTGGSQPYEICIHVHLHAWSIGRAGTTREGMWELRLAEAGLQEF